MMQTILIFLMDNMVLFMVLALLVYNIYGLLRNRKRRPRYQAGDEVLGQNYKTANGGFVPCRITGVYTVWVTRDQYYHTYEVKVTGASITLTLSEDRIKAVNK